MVSLGNGSRGAGGNFFNHEPLQNQEDEVLVADLVTISSAEDAQFRRIHTTWITFLMLLLLVAFEVLVFVLANLCQKGYCVIQGYSALVYLQASMWCLLLLHDQYLRWQHRTIRKAGYLQFYRKTQVLRRASLYIFSAGNVCLLVLSAIFREYCFNEAPCFTDIHFEPVNFLQLVMTAEFLISFPVLCIYLAQIIQFNKRKLPPDINHDNLLASFTDMRAPVAEIGYRDEDPSDEVVEKQADLIQYLKHHNVTLCQKLMQLTDELRQYKSYQGTAVN